MPEGFFNVVRQISTSNKNIDLMFFFTRESIICAWNASKECDNRVLGWMIWLDFLHSKILNQNSGQKRADPRQYR